MSPRFAWGWCLGAGLSLLLAALAFGCIEGLTPCGATGNLNAVMAFELARSPGEVAALFGEEPCRSALRHAQARAAWLDMLAFIPAYAAFLGLAAVALRRWARGWARPALGLVLVAALLDEIEGALLLALLGELPGPAWLFAPLYWTVRAKFLLLALGTGAVGAAMIRRGPVGMLAGTAMLGGTLTSLAVLFTNPHLPLLTEALRVAFIALLAAAAWFTLRPPASSAAG